MTTVLVFVAHPDDEVLGAGGTLATLAQRGATINVVFANDGGINHTTRDYNLRDEARAACKVLGANEPHFLNFPDQRLDIVAHQDMNNALEKLKLPDPDILFTHRSGDVNRDHECVHRSALVYARPPRVGMVVACEVLSSSEWGTQPFAPNWFFPLTQESLERKCDALACYEQEMRTTPHPRSKHGVLRLAETRGMQGGYKYAEAFQVLKAYGDFRCATKKEK